MKISATLRLNRALCPKRNEISYSNGKPHFKVKSISANTGNTIPANRPFAVESNLRIESF